MSRTEHLHISFCINQSRRRIETNTVFLRHRAAFVKKHGRCTPESIARIVVRVAAARLNHVNRPVPQSALDETKKEVFDLMKQTIRPEFLNRIDDIVLFRTLELSDVERIIELELQGLFERTRRLGYKVKITDGAKRRLAAMGYESRYGVRSLKRTLMDNVEEPLSTLIIDGKLHEGDTVVVESGKPHGVRIRVA